MARKYTKPVPAPKPDDGSKDLGILNPDITLELAGRTVTVREPRFVQGLRIRAKAHELTRDLTASIKSGEGFTDDVLDVLAKHDELARELVCEVTEGADVDWIEGLSDADGEKLLLAWWTCCGPFFVRQIARRLADEIRMQALVDSATAGATSSTPSPAPDTEPPTSLASATPSVN